MVNARNKGANGERQAISYLQKALKITGLERNLEQSRSGGYDIIGLEPLAIEVKRCQTVEKKKWWNQVVKATQHDPGLIPVVMFRRNRERWKFLISSSYMNLSGSYIQLDEDVFFRWAAQTLVER